VTFDKLKPNEHHGKHEEVTRTWELPQRQRKAKKICVELKDPGCR